MSEMCVCEGCQPCMDEVGGEGVGCVSVVCEGRLLVN